MLNVLCVYHSVHFDTQVEVKKASLRTVFCFPLYLIIFVQLCGMVKDAISCIPFCLKNMFKRVKHSVNL